MNTSVSHDRADERPEAKARWFQSLSLSERMALLCSFTDLALAVREDLPDKKDAQPTAGHIQVLSRP